MPTTTDGWQRFFDAWLSTFSSLLRAGRSQPWREHDPRERPFEYPDGISFHLASESSDWWNATIEFIHSDIKQAIAADLANRECATLMIGIHDIICQEALRQHTLIVRHTAPSDLLTLRSYRRGLLALYHGLIALPPAFAMRDSYRFPDFSGLPVQMGSTPAERFQFLYCGLFHRLLGDKSSDQMSYDWGADAIRLEIVMYAHDNFLGALREENRHKAAWAHDLAPLISKEMLNRHYEDMATASIRVGYNLRWNDIRDLLKEYIEQQGQKRPDFSSIPEQVLLHMKTVTAGPHSHESRGKSTRLLREFGIETKSFHAPPWMSAGRTSSPSVSEFSSQVDAIVQVAMLVPQEQLQHVVSLLFLFGIMHADLSESKIGTDEYPPARLLGYLVPLMAARRAWALSFHANSFEAAPYLMADGLRTLARLGLEILRNIQRQYQPVEIQARISDGDKSLLVFLTTEVRGCLDEYARDFYFQESERAQMLILESRFARTAYRLPAVQEYIQSKSPIVIESVWKLDSTGGLDVKRHEIALNFLLQVDRCLLRFHPLYSLRLRLLSERSSALRGLAHLQAQISKSSRTQDAKKRELKHTVKRLTHLTALEIEQMASICKEMSRTRKTWTDAEGATKWNGIIEYHRRKTKEAVRDL